MQFDFHSTRSILFKRGGSANLAKRIAKRGGKSVLLVTDCEVMFTELRQIIKPGLPVRLRDVGITNQDLDLLATNAMLQTFIQ